MLYLPAVFIQTTHRKRHDIAVKCFLVLGDGAALDALKAISEGSGVGDPRDAVAEADAGVPR